MPPSRRRRPSDHRSETSERIERTSEQQSTYRSWARSRQFLYLTQGLEDSIDELQVLARSSWAVHRVSPLFNFKTTASRLKQYGLHLRNWLTSKVNKDVVYKAELIVINGLTKSEHDSNALKVEVQCSVEGTQYKTVYYGLLISWDMKSTPTDNLLNLPVLLCRGNLSMRKFVHEGLSNFFDCSITPYQLNETELLWLNGLFASVSPQEKMKRGNVIFTYSVPGTSTRDKCQLTLPTDVIRKVWKRIHPQNSNILTAQEITAFYNALLEHVTNAYAFYDLNKLQLTELTYPVVHVTHDGRLRSSSVELMDQLLSYLCNESSLIEDVVIPITQE